MKTNIEIRLRGPFFDKVPQAVLEKHLRATIGEVTDEGAEEARRIAQGFTKTGRYQEAIRGKLGKRLRGRVMVGAGRRRGKLPSPKVYRKVVEGGRYWKSTGTRFKGHHTLSRARRAVEPRVVPILSKHLQKFVRELN